MVYTLFNVMQFSGCLCANSVAIRTISLETISSVNVRMSSQCRRVGVANWPCHGARDGKCWRKKLVSAADSARLQMLEDQLEESEKCGVAHPRVEEFELVDR